MRLSETICQTGHETPGRRPHRAVAALVFVERESRYEGGGPII
jgi:hypothetical protein